MANIRRADISDIIDIRNCNQECLPENYTSFVYLSFLTGYPSAQFVAEADKKIVGYILTKINDDGSFHISSLAIKRQYRRSGIASALIKMVIKLSKNKVTLEVRPSNKAALALYISSGFKHTRTEKKYYADGEDAWEMSSST